MNQRNKMSKNKNIFMSLLVFVLVTALILPLNISCKPDQVETRSSKAQLYCAALDSLIPIDDALNSDMKYIAIDINTLEISTDKEKETIKECFSKYQVPVVFDSYESLKEKGKVIDDSYIEGILLSVEKTEISDNNAIIECSKYKSGLGAIGVHVELKFEDDIWKVEVAEITWAS
jgi:hypothetical protein